MTVFGTEVSWIWVVEKAWVSMVSVNLASVESGGVTCVVFWVVCCLSISGGLVSRIG